jgi:hypothetical protein
MVSGWPRPIVIDLRLVENARLPLDITHSLCLTLDQHSLFETSIPETPNV